VKKRRIRDAKAARRRAARQERINAQNLADDREGW
jgi:hypothetical protein